MYLGQQEKYQHNDLFSQLRLRADIAGYSTKKANQREN